MNAYGCRRTAGTDSAGSGFKSRGAPVRPTETSWHFKAFHVHIWVRRQPPRPAQALASGTRDGLPEGASSTRVRARLAFGSAGEGAGTDRRGRARRLIDARRGGAPARRHARLRHRRHTTCLSTAPASSRQGLSAQGSSQAGPAQITELTYGPEAKADASSFALARGSSTR